MTNLQIQWHQTLGPKLAKTSDSVPKQNWPVFEARVLGTEFYNTIDEAIARKLELYTSGPSTPHRFELENKRKRKLNRSEEFVYNTEDEDSEAHQTAEFVSDRIAQTCDKDDSVIVSRVELNAVLASLKTMQSRLDILTTINSRLEQVAGIT